MKGKFKAKAKAWILGETSTGGEEIAVEFDVLTEGAEYSVLTWRGYFTDAAWERTIESLRHMGWKGDNLANLEGLDTNEVELVVEEEEYNGKIQTKVRWVNRASGLNVKAPLTEDRKRSFAASMKDKIRAMEAAKGNRNTATTQRQTQRPQLPSGPPEPPPIGDEDLPF